jgi:hypothetical protein
MWGAITARRWLKVEVVLRRIYESTVPARNKTEVAIRAIAMSRTRLPAKVEVIRFSNKPIAPKINPAVKPSEVAATHARK